MVPFKRKFNFKRFKVALLSYKTFFLFKYIYRFLLVSPIFFYRRFNYYFKRFACFFKKIYYFSCYFHKNFKRRKIFSIIFKNFKRLFVEKKYLAIKSILGFFFLKKKAVLKKVRTFSHFHIKKFFKNSVIKLDFKGLFSSIKFPFKNTLKFFKFSRIDYI